MIFRDLFNTLQYIFKHPVTRNNKWAAVRRFTRWQIQSRTFKNQIVYPFIEHSKLIVQNGMTGATGNIYTGLHEFEDMMFLLHLLRPGDVFADVGANIGSYTVLSSAVAGAKTIAFEPVPSTFLWLKNNVAVNNAEGLVQLYNAGVGKEVGELNFTSGLDTMNHVVSGGSDGVSDLIQVKILKLDDLLANKIPVLIKIDTEGFEMSVLEGATSTLAHPDLMAIIVELNGSCHRYGIDEKDIHAFLVNRGFAPVSYNPFERMLSYKPGFNTDGNTIYIKNENKIKDRLETARKFKVLNLCV